MITEARCVCGNKAKLTIGTVTHRPFERAIKVHNVPHFNCNYCDSVYYNSEVKISEYIIKAYKEGVNEINYSQ